MKCQQCKQDRQHGSVVAKDSWDKDVWCCNRCQVANRMWDLRAAWLYAEADEYEATLPVGAALYIRFGSLPKGGFSHNFATGEQEPGIAVYAATEQDGVIRYDDAEGLGNPYGLLFFLNRPTYLVRGFEIGQRGSDGEPLLLNVQMICRLRYNKKANGFKRAVHKPRRQEATQ